MRILLVPALGLLLWCCGPDKEKCAFIPDTSAIKVELQWESLEDSLPAIQTKEDLVRFFSRYPVMRDVFFNRPAYPGDSTFINRLYNRFSNKHIDTLLMEVHRVFGDGRALRADFEKAFANVKYYYPDFEPPRIQTVLTGLETDLYVSDTLLIIGLDYYLGEGAKYRPNMYGYMQRRYNRDFIIPSVMLLYGIDTRFNKINLSDKTVLADMVAYGKAYYFTKQMLPCTPDSVLIGYTKKEMDGSRQYESLIWSRLVEDKVLYATSHLVKQKFIAERPKTIEVGEECPGRIATWVGWQIVNKFMEEHKEVALPDLMKMDDANKLFTESGYRPKLERLPRKETIN